MTIEYRVVNGTSYNTETNEDVIRVLETARANRTRITVFYGTPEKGLWGDKETGYVGRSTGEVKCPLIVFNSRSMGGGAILSERILKIVTSKGCRTLYKHECLGVDYREKLDSIEITN